jgi:predicted porin
MKKSLLALAVLTAVSGAASAQSSVTLYGKIDLGMVWMTLVPLRASRFASTPASRVARASASRASKTSVAA